MRIRIDLKVFIFAVLFYFTGQLKLYFIFMGFALLHEFAHLLTGIILKFRLKYIELMPLGFCALMQPSIDDYNKKIKKSTIIEVKYFFIAISGPLLNLILSIIFFENKENILAYSNLIILILNIFPIYPLDGGRVLKSILRILLGHKSSEKIINIITNTFAILITICGSIGILYLKNIAILLILIYIWELVIKENKRFEMRKKIFMNDDRVLS